MLPALLRMSLIQKALGYQPGAFVLSVVVVDNLPQSYPQCKSLKELYSLTQKFRRYFTQYANNVMITSCQVLNFDALLIQGNLTYTVISYVTIKLSSNKSSSIFIKS